MNRFSKVKSDHPIVVVVVVVHIHVHNNNHNNNWMVTLDFCKSIHFMVVAVIIFLLGTYHSELTLILLWLQLVS